LRCGRLEKPLYDIVLGKEVAAYELKESAMKTVKHKSAHKNTSQKGDSLGDRMKRYESVPRNSPLSPRTP
jgi:hypothetical protein